MTDVDCEGCDARCCKRFFVFAPASIPGRRAKPSPPSENQWAAAGIPVKVHYIKHGWANMSCEALVDARCAVYDDRPSICRTYDCRKDVGRINATDEGARCDWPRAS